MVSLSRRTLISLFAPTLVATRTARAASVAATTGAAPFDTPDLLPGADFDLTRVDLRQAKRQVAALTFDDGPDENDAAIRELLAQYRIPATFFVIGEKVAAHADQIRAHVAAGHEVANHTFKHPMMTKETPASQRWNLAETNAVLATLGVHPTWFRPPFGDFNDEVAAEAGRQGLRTILWTLDSRDWKSTTTTEDIAKRVSERMRAGTVTLMHSTHPVSTRALPRVIEAGLAKGLRFVTMSAWYAAMAPA